MAKKTSESASTETAAAGDTAASPASGRGPDGERGRRKTRIGVVASARMNKTVTVVVERRVAHPAYGKQQTRTKKYHAHDEKNEYKIGDVVQIVETRPISKTKRWRVAELIERPE
jgi:small subunit ribosomal protein S17